MLVEVEMLLDDVLQVVGKYVLPLPSGVAELSHRHPSAMFSRI